MKNSKTIKIIKVAPVKISVGDAVAELTAGFTTCKEAKENHEGGAMRSGKDGKGNIWEKFMVQILMNVIHNLNLPYTVQIGYKVHIMGDLYVNMDITILDANNVPIYHIEVKDYTDTSMYKRFAADNFLLVSRYPTMKFISLSGWVASTTTQNVIDTIFGIDDATYSDTLLSSKRKSSDNLFILDRSADVLIKSANDLITRLEKVIK
jgi:hypothetical protein